MSEIVQDLILLDLVLKDRDGNFVINFSGYINISFKNSTDKLQYQENL
jgi:hypothetical protein